MKQDATLFPINRRSLLKQAILAATVSQAGVRMLRAQQVLNQRQVTATPDTLHLELRRLEPGVDLLLAPGDYREGLPLRDLIGSAAKPIRLRPLDPASPPKFHATKGRNVCNIARSAHVHLLGLHFEGHGLAGCDAVKLEGEAGNWGYAIHIEDCLMTGFGGSQQTVGISTKAPAWEWVVRGNTMIAPGTGMYFGSPVGDWAFVGGLVENNVILDPVGYCIQIKHHTQRPRASEFPKVPQHYFEKTFDTVLLGNVLSKQNSDLRKTEGWRPNLLIGHLPQEGAGANDRYLIHQNFFHDNSQEYLLQAEGRFALYNNLFVNSLGNAVNIQPHNHHPSDFLVLHNTIFAHELGLRVLTAIGHPPKRAIVAGNFVTAAQAYRGQTRGSMITRPRSSRGWPVLPGDALLAPNDVLPPVSDTVDLLSTLPAGLTDFGRNPRTRFTVGAFDQTHGVNAPLAPRLEKFRP